MIGLGEVIAVTRDEIDLANIAQIDAVVQSSGADVIVNAAAYTNVEGAESDESTAQAINGAAVAALASCARASGALLVHYSTDYVFDGLKDTPYSEDDATAPLSAYGRSKLAGELAIRASGCRHFILRTSWVYAARGKNFLRTILRLAAQRAELSIVADQHGAPTSARLIAQETALLVRAASAVASQRARVDAGCTLHLTAAGHATWFEFAAAIREIALHLGLPFAATLRPIPADQYPTKTSRPGNSRLDLSRIERDWDVHAPSWRYALQLVMEEVADQAANSGQPGTPA